MTETIIGALITGGLSLLGVIITSNKTTREVQAKLEELQRRYDERASQLSRSRKSMLRGNPTARSARYDAVLQKLKIRLQDRDRTD